MKSSILQYDHFSLSMQIIGLLAGLLFGYMTPGASAAQTMNFSYVTGKFAITMSSTFLKEH